jgi:hypothetical protein
MALFIPNETNAITNVLNTNFAMYPNPVQSILQLNNISNVTTISIYTILGNQVHNQVNAKNSVNLDLSELNAGIYIIEFTTATGVNAKRFIKE